jgi:hypothetical protein
MSSIVIVVTVVAVGALMVILSREGHPENGCFHGDHAKERDGELFYSRVDRPAGPDAEDASLEHDPAAPRRQSPRRSRLLHLGARSR